MSEKKLLNAGQSPFGWHRIQKFMHCPTKYYYSYIANEPRGSASSGLIRGSLLHTGLAHHYAIMKAHQNNEDHNLYQPMSAMMIQAEEEGEVWNDEVEHCVEVLAEYMHDKQVKEWEQNWEILHVEDVFAMNIEEYELTFRADLVARNKTDNRVYIIDHKTSGQIRTDTTKGYEASGQVIGFHVLGERIWGNDFGGLIINYVQHGGKRKTPKIKFERQSVTKSESHIKTFAQSVYFYRKLIEHYKDKDVKHYPRVQSEFTCMHKYGSCEYYDKCFDNHNNQK